MIYPRNLLTQLLRAVAQDGVGSVTAWSNNVSLYSLRNDDPDRFLADQERVDWLSETLAGHYGDAVLDIPAGISFCILVPTAVVRDVGVMDPVFGRGYCEETDWSLRSMQAGYRVALAPGTFVYHAGRGSNLDAGLVTSRHTSVPDNEAIIDLRYPRLPRPGEGVRVAGACSSRPSRVRRRRDHAPGRPGARLHDRRRMAAAVAGRRRRRAVHRRPRRRRRGLDGLPGLQAVLRDVDAFRVAESLKDYFGGRPPSRSTFATAARWPRPSVRVLRPGPRHGNYPSRV